jgi:hypothetical protein
MQTKAKGCWDIMAIEPYITLNAIRTNPHGLGQIAPAIGADPQRTPVFLQPVVWQALDHVFGSEWPGLRGTGVEEAGLTLRIAQMVRKFSWDEDTLPGFFVATDAYAIIFLATLATEDEW